MPGLTQKAGRRARACASAMALAVALASAAAHAQAGAPAPAPVPPVALPPAPGELPIPSPPPGAVFPPVEPIISDEEFQAAIPALDPSTDPELEGPLESIEAFERRIAEEQASAKPGEGQQPPLGLPALADGDPVEEIGDAPVRDPELAAPLPPLDQFQVAPVQFAEDESDSEIVVVQYAVTINGLDAADAATEVDLRDQFDDLSALKGAEGKAANVAQVAARLTEDSVLLQRILAAEGWHGAQVQTRIDRSEASNGQPLAAVIDVVPGPRYTFSDIVIAAPPTEPVDLIRSNLALQVGEPIVAQRVQGAEAQVAITLPQQGYPFAEVGQRDILLDPDTGGGAYTLPVTTGPRSRFGGIETTGDLAFDAEHVEVLARFKRGELYDSRDVDDLRQALVATGLFNTVTVTPQRTGQPTENGDGTEYATIRVEQDAGPPRTLAGSAGYGTGQGFRLEGSWTHRNLFPPEGALIASGVAGTQEQGASVRFRRANAGKRDRTFQLAAEALHSNYDAFEAFTGRLSALVSYESTPIWQKTLTYALGAQLIGTNEQDFDIAANERIRRTFFVGGLTGQVGFDRTNDLLDATKGFRVTALIEPEGSLQDGFTPYVRGRLDASGYFPFGDSIVVAGRVRVGTIQGIERFDLAPSRRFYAGGGGSVRGFGYQELGPKVLEPNPKFDPDDPDEEDDPLITRPIGGRSLNEAAVEVRYRFGNYGVVGFVDAGQVYEESFPQFSDIRFGAGIGGRFYTNFGPLRLDVAMPLNRQRGESKFAVYASIGQAF